MNHTFHVARRLLGALAVLAALTPSGHARAEKLRDLVDVAGVRQNQLLGYGIVTGLSGTGDDTTNLVAAQSVLSLLRRMGVQVDPTQIKLRNVAAVVVTADLNAFARSGTRLDVTVSSIGNAKSLSGGVLVQTLLKGADQKTYAVAQGNVITGGVKPTGGGGNAVTTAGRVPDGAIVEREVVGAWVDNNTVKLSLRNPSFSVAARVVEAIDKGLGSGTAKAEDGGGLVLKVPSKFQGKPVEFIAALEDLEVTVVRRARVVVSERTQTIVAGGDVRLSPAVVVHGGLTVVVKEMPGVAAPNPRRGAPAPAATAAPAAGQNESHEMVRLVPRAATLADVSSALNALGLTPRELASVLEAMHTAGALEAEVVVQ